MSLRYFPTGLPHTFTVEAGGRRATVRRVTQREWAARPAGASKWQRSSFGRTRAAAARQALGLDR